MCKVLNISGVLIITEVLLIVVHSATHFRELNNVRYSTYLNETIKSVSLKKMYVHVVLWTTLIVPLYIYNILTLFN